MSTNNAINAPLPISAVNGGTGINTYSTGDTLYSGSSNTLTVLHGNSTATKLFLSQTGTGSASQAPTWSAVSSADISGLGTMATQNSNSVSITGGSIELTGAMILRVGIVSSAPLTFQSGTNLTIAVSGAVEFNGSNYFFTTGAGRRQAVLTDVSTPSSGKLPIGNGTDYTLATLTAGANITITNGAGSITIASSAGSEQLIASSVLGSPASTVSFTSIPGSFNHLKLICTGRFGNASLIGSMIIQFNSDTGNNYSNQYLRITNASVNGGVNYTQSSGFLSDWPAASTTANYSGDCVAYITNYAGTIFNKNVVSTTTNLSGSTDTNITQNWGSSWNNTAAITRIDLKEAGGANFITGSSFYLYGIT